MNPSPREKTKHASAALDAAEQQLASLAQGWRQRFDHPSLRVLVSSGFVGGFMLTMIPPRWWSRAGAAVFGTGAALARSPLGPVLFAALWTRILAPAKSPTADPRATSDQP